MATAAQIFSDMESIILAGGAEMIGGVFCIMVDDKAWTVDLNSGRVMDGRPHGKTDCTFAMAEEDLVKIFNGSLTPMKAFFTGKMKMQGNMGLGTRFHPDLFDRSRIVPKSPTSSVRIDGVTVATVAGKGAESGEGFASMEVYHMFKAAIAAKGPEFCKQVKGVIMYVLTAGPDDKTWTFYTDLKKAPGMIAEGKPKKRPNLTITIKDADFLGLAQGKMKPQTAFMRGRLKIKGNMGLAMKLEKIIDVARKEFGPNM